MSKKINNKELTKALLKKALGYNVNEVVEEYSVEENEIKLLKKKVTKKHIPPDLATAKALLELYCQDDTTQISQMTEEELNKEKARLLLLLKDFEEGKCDN